MPDGSLLVVSMRDRRILRWSDDGVTLHADVSDYCGGHLNDMVVDSRGRAYVGNFGFDLMASPTRRRRRSCASTPTAPPPSWPRTCCSRTAR